MRGGRSERKGMRLRGMDANLRPPPPKHFLFHFLSSPSLPLSLLLTSYLFSSLRSTLHLRAPIKPIAAFELDFTSVSLFFHSIIFSTLQEAVVKSHILDYKDRLLIIKILDIFFKASMREVVSQIGLNYM